MTDFKTGVWDNGYDEMAKTKSRVQQSDENENPARISMRDDLQKLFNKFMEDYIKIIANHGLNFNKLGTQHIINEYTENPINLKMAAIKTFMNFLPEYTSEMLMEDIKMEYDNESTKKSD